MDVPTSAEAKQYGEHYSHLLDTASRSQDRLARIRDAVLTYSEIVFPLGLHAGDTLLDVGSGIGRPGHYARYRGINTVNADLNLASHEVAAETWGEQRHNLPVVANGSTSLPFRNDAFDAVCSQDFLEHVNPDMLDTAFSEMERVLGGNKMVHRITVTEEPENMYGDSTHQTFWSAAEWQDWFAGKGWQTAAPTSRRIYKPGTNLFGLAPYCHGYFLLEKK